MGENYDNNYDNFEMIPEKTDTGGEWETFEIPVTNTLNHATVNLQVVKEHKLGEIKDLVREPLGLPKDESKLIYINKNTLETTTDGKLTLEKFGIKNSSGALQINPDGTVA